MPLLLAVLAHAARRLPPRGDRFLAALAGPVWCACDRGRRAAVCANRAALAADFPLDRPFRSYLLALLGWLRLLGLDADAVRRASRVEGLEIAREAARARAGTVLVAAHVGEWEWGAAALAARGLRVVAVAGTQLSAAWTPALRAAKARLGIEVVDP